MTKMATARVGPIAPACQLNVVSTCDDVALRMGAFVLLRVAWVENCKRGSYNFSV